MARLAGPLLDAARSAGRLDRSKVSVDVGARVALGVALCLIVGRVSGHTVAGVTATIGALTAGMASHQGTYRSRVGIVLAAGTVTGFCAAVGCLVGHILWLYALVVAVIGWGAGMFVSFGPAGTAVGVQAVVGLVVFSQFDLPLAVAARDGGLVLAGAAVQAVLVVAVWPLRRFQAERMALSAAFAALAAYSRQSANGGDSDAVIELGPFEGLEAVWRDAQPFGGDEIAAYRALAGQADRLRLELTALVRARSRLTGVSGSIDEVLATTADILSEVASALREARAASGWEADRVRFRAAVDRLRASSAEGSGWSAAAALEAGSRVEALAGQLRAVLRTAAVPTGLPAEQMTVAMTDIRGLPVGRPRTATWVRERSGTLRSNLTFSSQSFRHAVRMAVTLAAAALLSHALPYDHRYWLPMTALLVLRPDFTSTVARGVARVLGTLFGAGVVTVALAELRPGPDWLIALVVVLTFPAATLVLANYALFSALIASLVVALLAFTGEPGLDTAFDRSIYTLLGAAVAFVAYFAWPTWEATTLSETVANLLRTEGRYARLVLEAWSGPADADRAALQRVRLDARLARSNAEAAVARWLAEPDVERGFGDRETVLGIMASIRSAVAALLTLHAELPEAGAGQEGAGRLGADVEAALGMVADAVKGSPPDAAFPPLRREQLALSSGLRGSDRPPSPPGSVVVLAGETDLLVDAVDGIGHLLGLGGVTEGT